MTYTDEQLIAIGKEALEKNATRQAQIKLASAKRFHKANEALRIVKENGLEDQIRPFTDTIADYQ